LKLRFKNLRIIFAPFCILETAPLFTLLHSRFAVKLQIKLLTTFLIVLAWCSGALAQSTATPAGTSIPNVASGSYTDANGKTVLITSNQAIITVSSVCGISVLPHGSSSAPGQNTSIVPGGTKYLSYSISNTGNGDFVLNLTPTLEAGSSFTPANLTVFLDANNDAQPDGAAISSLSLAADSSSHVLRRVDAPSPLEGGLVANVNLIASCPGGPSDANNVSRVVVDPRADLSLIKTHAGDLNIGQVTRYTLQVSNLGPSSAGATIGVTDTLPTGLEFVSGGNANWVCNAAIQAGKQVVTCTSPTAIANGANSSFDLNLKVLATATTSSLVNTASVSSPTIDPKPDNNTALDTGLIIVSDLRITKNHVGDFVRGSSGIYTLRVNNSGSAPSFGDVKVTDTLPDGLSLQSAAGTGWTCAVNIQTLNCTRQDVLAAGSSFPDIAVTVGIAQNAAASLVNTASVSGGAQLDTGNDTASDTVDVISRSDLSIAKTDNTNTVIPGTSLSYTITLSNAGPSDASGVNVLDSLPASLSAATWTCAANPGSSCGAASGAGNLNETVNLPAGTSLVYTLNASLSSDATGNLSNTASLVAPPGTLDPNPANDSATDTDSITPNADLSINKQHLGTFTVGVNGQYVLTVRNLGPSTIPGAITVTDNLPAGLGYIAASGTDWTCGAVVNVVTCTHPGNVAPNSSLPEIGLTLSVGVAALPSVTNTASVSSATLDLQPANNSASDSTNVVFVEPWIGPLNNPKAKEYPNPADLQSSQEYQGKTIFYRHTVLNSGDTGDILNLRLETPLPSGWTARWLAADGTALTDTNNDGLPDVGVLGSNLSTVVILELRAPSTTVGDNGGSGWNWVSSVSSSVKPDAINRTLDVTSLIRPASDAWKILKSLANNKTLKPGDSLEYSLDVTNLANFAQDNVTITDALDPNLAAPTGITTGSVTDASDPTKTYSITGTYDSSSRTITWKLANLPSFGRFILKFKTAILETTPDATVVPNTAFVVSDTIPVAVGSNRVDAGVIRSILAVDKIALRPTVSIGGTVDFELKILNNSATAGLVDLVVTDDLPIGLLYQPGSSRLAGSSIPDPSITVSNGKQRLEWKIASLAAKNSISIVFTSLGTPALPEKVVNTVTVSAHSAASSQIVVVSNTATAAVKKADGAFSQRNVLVGRVYFDTNDNLRFDQGQDEVLKGARVYLSNGNYAITDAQGRYSFADLAAGSYAIRLDPLTVPYIPKHVPEDEGSPGTRYVRLTNGLETKDFPLYPVKAVAVKSRSTTIRRGEIQLQKSLIQGGAGYGVNMVLTVDHPVQNFLLTDPLPNGASRGVIVLTYPDGTSRVVTLNGDGALELGELEPGTYKITYALFTDLEPEYALTDPDIEWEEGEK
jgi:uncharacterized repeat protein (TIGR01451 family)/fimbrial isopeptide formation D2 family protein